MSVNPVTVSASMICRGLCACTEMFWMCVLYVSFGSKVRPITFGCVAMGIALFIVRSSMCGTPAYVWNASFKLTFSGCVISICCVGFASLDVVCD